MRTILFFLLVVVGINASAQSFRGKWIGATTADGNGASSLPVKNTPPNTWIGFTKNFVVNLVPAAIPIRIAADSKYWLYINGKLVVADGGLKRGPNPFDTYYDSLNIAPYLQIGQNKIAILLWHFGKSGYSHINSGKAGLLVDCLINSIDIVSNSSWKSIDLPAYQSMDVQPNTRLSESNLQYDAQKEKPNWFADSTYAGSDAVELGDAGIAPWNNLILRPIPLFYLSENKKYSNETRKKINGQSAIVARLPFNQQVHPYFIINSNQAGVPIRIYTNNNLSTPEEIVQAKYITKVGKQVFEVPYWLNGEEVIYEIPDGIEVNEIGYKSSGYPTNVVGNFTTNDPFWNTLWQKSLTTLQLSFRDNFMDTPDRERAGWIGDIVSLIKQSQYSLDGTAQLLSKKTINEFSNWQTSNGDFMSIIPTGNSNIEIPAQSLHFLGLEGIWAYFMLSNDSSALTKIYPGAKRNLSFWQKKANGLMTIRDGGNRWIWGDWGENVDMEALYNMHFASTLASMSKMAGVMGLKNDSLYYKKEFDLLATAIKNNLFTNSYFASPEFVNHPDERVQAFAVLTGIADSSMYPRFKQLLTNHFNYTASPYLEAAIVEALFKMGEFTEAIGRFRVRYIPMVYNNNYSTVWEGWNTPRENKVPKSANHGWSGSALYILPKWVAGIQPKLPGFKEAIILPNLTNISSFNCSVPTQFGLIKNESKRVGEKLTMKITVPAGIQASIPVANYFKTLALNKTVLLEKNQLSTAASQYIKGEGKNKEIIVGQGVWELEANYTDYYIEQLKLPTSILLEKNQLLIYPNPVRSYLEVNIVPIAGKINQCRIYTIEGKLVATANAGELGFQPINVSTLTNGIYLIEVIQGEEPVKRGKFIKF